MGKKSNKEVALEVIAGKWGAGDKRKSKLKKAGYNYEAVQKKVNELAKNKSVSVKKMNKWAENIANDNDYHYKKWDSKDEKTHECPICNKYPKGEYYGWNGIGFAFATWHHGGGLDCKCSCYTVSSKVSEQIANAKTDTEALKLAKKYVGINNIQVIRNNGKNVAKNKWRAGDICIMFKGKTYHHTFYYKGGETIIDSSVADGKPANQIKARGYKNYSARIIIRYLGDFNKEEPKPETNEKKKYSGKIPTLKIKKSTEEVIKDTIRWAKLIAGDNRFHYGYTNKKVNPWKPNAHHNGCYFCGTNTTKGGRSKKGILDYKFTYCCNPFVGAAWAHGGCVPKAMSLCTHGGSWNFEKGTGYDASSLFKNLGHPKKSKLKAGDVLCNDYHVALYVGNGKIAEASGGDDNKRNSSKWNKSIRVITLSDSRYKDFKRVHRYIGSVNTTASIKHGEISDRVAEWQAFLDWYFDGKAGKPDRYFGDNTLKWTKKFQKEVGLKDDGIVGNASLEKVKAVEK